MLRPLETPEMIDPKTDLVNAHPRVNQQICLTPLNIKHHQLRDVLKIMQL